MEPSTFWATVRYGSLAIGGGVAAWAIGRRVYRAGVKLYDDLYQRWRQAKHDRLTLEHIATQNELQGIRTIPPDERGRWPLLYGKAGILRDPNNLRAFTLTAVIERWPRLERLDWMHKQLIALQGVQAGTARQLPELTPSAAVRWPATITLDDLLKRSGARPGLHRLALGVTFDGDQERIVYGDMQSMVHVLVSGASGFGKSTLLEALAKQLILGGDCDVCAVDYGVNTFGALGDHLAYPIADTPGLAVALFRELIAELQRRRAMFQDYPRVKDLGQFNTTTGGDLRPLVCFVDESASLFTQEGTKGPATELSQMGRKYGLGLVLAGTDFKATTLPTEATGNCGARIALHLRPSLSQSLLGNRAASDLKDKGRALCELPGTPGLIELQCPIVRRWDDLPAKRPQVELAPSDGLTTVSTGDDQAATIRKMHDDGTSLNQIQRELFGYVGGQAFALVKAAIADTTTTPGSDTPDADDLGGDGHSSSIADWCDFCGRGPEMAKSTTFGECTACGVAVCGDCALGGLCPDCVERGV